MRLSITHELFVPEVGVGLAVVYLICNGYVSFIVMLNAVPFPLFVMLIVKFNSVLAFAKLVLAVFANVKFVEISPYDTFKK